MKSNHKFIESPEFDEFFRRGDEPAQLADSLQPVAGICQDGELEPESLRTPAQRERRARFIKLVSVMMAFLTVGSATAFTYKAVQGRSQRLTASLALQPDADLQFASPPLQEQEVARSRPIRHDTVDLSQVTSAPASERVVPVQAKVAEPPVQAQRAADSKAPELGAKERAVSAPPSNSTRVATATGDQSVARAAIETEKATSIAPAARPVAATAVQLATKNAVNGSVPIVSPAGALGVRAKSRPARLTVAKRVGPKPEGYHPPTASFSD